MMKQPETETLISEYKSGKIDMPYAIAPATLKIRVSCKVDTMVAYGMQFGSEPKQVDISGIQGSLFHHFFATFRLLFLYFSFYF